MAKNLFWLHIKKSGGSAIRNALQPYYTLVDRIEKPANFIQSQPSQYNDILNNYRVVLGEYTHKRTLFAKKFLYKERWPEMESFAVSREPIDRFLSMYFYLFGRKLFLKHSTKHPRLLYSNKYRIDYFLDCVSAVQESNSIYFPLGLHFTTHTARMFPDVTDENDMVLLNKIYRLENWERGIHEVLESCGVTHHKLEAGIINKSYKRKELSLSSSQIHKIVNLYEHDFELYENGL